MSWWAHFSVAAGRLTGIDYPEPDADVSYTYDAAGNRVEMLDGLGETAWRHDALGRVTAVTDPFGDQVGYAYDAAGNRTSLTYPDGKLVTYDYDPAGRLVEVQDWGGGSTAYEYDAAGRVVQARSPAGVTTGYRYNPAGWLTGVGHSASRGVLSSFEYDYDSNGNRVTAVESLLTPGEPDASLYFSDDGEHGPWSWEAAGDWALAEGEGRGAGHAWSLNPEGEAQSNTDQSLTQLNLVEIPAEAEEPGLVFYDQADVAGDTSLRVEIRVPGGQWAELGVVPGGGAVGARGANGGWRHQRFDLAEYAGLSVQVRFRAVQDGSGYVDAWLIDDVRVGEAPEYALHLPLVLRGASGGEGTEGLEEAVTLTATPTATATATGTATSSPTGTAEPSSTPSGTAPPGVTPTASPTLAPPTSTATQSPTQADTEAPTPTGTDPPTVPPTSTLTATVTPPPSPTGTLTPTPEPTATAEGSAALGGHAGLLALAPDLLEPRVAGNPDATAQASGALGGHGELLELAPGALEPTLAGTSNATAQASGALGGHGGLLELAPGLLEPSVGAFPTATAQWMGVRADQGGLLAPSPGLLDPTPEPGGYLEQVIHYSYDPLNRLTEANYDTGEFFRYTYDPVGNRLAQETLSGTNSYTYDVANRLAELDGVTFSWDKNGNLLNDGSRDFTYDHANRLIALSDRGTTYGYAYNGLGDRLQQTVEGVPTKYTLDINRGLTQVLSDSSSAYLYGLGRIGEHGSDGWRYHLGDALGSVRQLADPTVEIPLAQSYTPFGSVLESTGEAESAYGFTGEWTDLTGLVHLRARYYEPAWGRFFQPDPWDGVSSEPSTLNPYAYALSDPVVNTDPSGRVVCLYGRDPVTRECNPRPEGLPGWYDPLAGPFGISKTSFGVAPTSPLQYLVFAAVALCTPLAVKVIKEAPTLPDIEVPEWLIDPFGGRRMWGDVAGQAEWVRPAPTPPPNPEPEATKPPPGPVQVPTETPRPVRRYVADSSIFMERQTSLEHVETARLLENRRVTLLLAQSLFQEIVHMTETAMRAFSGQGARIIMTPDPDLDHLDISGLTSRRFNRADLVLVETARIHGLPVVTLNRHLIGQMYDHPERSRLWGTVTIILPPFP